MASASATTTSTTTTTTIGPEQSNLVFWWDAGNPLSYQSYYGQQNYSSTILNDCSPPHQYRFPGLVTGSDSYLYTGKWGGSITFKNAKIEMPQTIVTSYLNNSLSYSVTIVIYPVVTGCSCVLELGQTSTTGGWISQNIAQETISKTFIAAEYSSNDGNNNTCQSEPAMANNPYIITYTYQTPNNYNGSEGILKLYVNGVLQSTQTGVNRTPPYYNGQGYAFGFGTLVSNWDLGSTNAFSGDFVAMMMHSIALSDKQIEDIYKYYIPRFSISTTPAPIVAGKGFMAYGSSNSGLTNTLTTCYRLTYNTNVISSESAAVAPARANAASMIKTGGNGYVAGGNSNSAVINSIARLDPTTVTWTANASNLTVARGGCSGIQSATVGYVAGGRTTTATIAATNAIDKFVFSTNVCSANTGTLLNTPYEPAGLSNVGLVCGYFSGGATNIPAVATTQRQRFNFALEQCTSMATGLLYGLDSMCTFYSSLNGYMVGGTSPAANPQAWGIVSIVSKINYSTEALSYINDIPYVISDAAGLQSSVSGYALGGTHADGVANRTIQMPFSTEVSFCNNPYLPAATTAANGLSTN